MSEDVSTAPSAVSPGMAVGLGWLAIGTGAINAAAWGIRGLPDLSAYAGGVVFGGVVVRVASQRSGPWVRAGAAIVAGFLLLQLALGTSGTLEYLEAVPVPSRSPFKLCVGGIIGIPWLFQLATLAGALYLMVKGPAQPVSPAEHLGPTNVD